MCARFIDLTGQSFGKLTVVKRNPVNDPQGRALWQCVCSCGKTKTVSGGNLRSGSTSSCGCYRKEYQAKTNGENGKRSFRGIGTLSGSYLAVVRCGASSRNIPYNITKEQAYAQLIHQEHKCALTGIEIWCDPAYHSPRRNQTASLDRRDSSFGYTPDNIQWVHKTINTLKMDLPQNEFIDWCRRVVEHADHKTRQRTLIK